MKNYQQGFAPLIIIGIIVAILAIGGGAYYVGTKNVEAPAVDNATTTQPVLGTEIEQTNDDVNIPVATQPADTETDTTKPVISYMTPTSGAVGTTVEIRGTNLAGFEGDLIAIFERADGKKVELRSTDQANKSVVKVKVQLPCQRGETIYGAYSGQPSPCDYFEFTPGVYKVYVNPWNKKSNIVQFTVTQPIGIFANWKTYTSTKTYGNNKTSATFSYPESYNLNPKLDSGPDILANYDTTKYQKDNPNGVYIQISKNLNLTAFDLSIIDGQQKFIDKINQDIIKSEMESQTTITSSNLGSVKYTTRIIKGPGGVFDQYYAFSPSGKSYYTISVWGASNDYANVQNILRSFSISE